MILAVIGGGASGLFAGINAAEEAERLGIKADITVYEGLPRTGKKILATGNGRCNFTNKSITEENFHGDRGLAWRVYKDFDNGKTVEFFRNAGLYSKSDNAGRIYPASFQASAVLDILRAEIKRLGIKEHTEEKITSLSKKGGKFLLNGKFTADRCILAPGGMAASVHGSDGSGFDLIRDKGIEIAPLYPALTALEAENFPKGLKGIRAQGSIEIRCGGKIYGADTGEIQYTDYGLSGIPAMQVSGAVPPLLESGKPVTAVVDSCPDFEEQELNSALIKAIRHNPSVPGDILLSGFMPKKLGSFILSSLSINPSKEAGLLKEAVVRKIAAACKEKKYRITGVKGFRDAQVTAGGIRAEEIDENTMELKKIKGLYVCGEIVNVHGDCGGFNLQWAWSSGHKAGISSVREK